MARPRSDGGVWGSYVQYLEDLEDEVAILHAANEELAQRLTDLDNFVGSRQTPKNVKRYTAHLDGDDS